MYGGLAGDGIGNVGDRNTGELDAALDEGRRGSGQADKEGDGQEDGGETHSDVGRGVGGGKVLGRLGEGIQIEEKRHSKPGFKHLQGNWFTQ